MNEATATIALLVAALLIVSGCALWLMRLNESLVSRQLQYRVSCIIATNRLSEVLGAFAGLGEQGQGEAVVILRLRLESLARELEYMESLAKKSPESSGAKGAGRAHGERCNHGTR